MPMVGTQKASFFCLNAAGATAAAFALPATDPLRSYPFKVEERSRLR